MPRLPNPEEARLHITGQGHAKAWFDDKGQCTKVTITVSTGSELLDGNTVAFGWAKWVGPPNLVVNVPITYKLNR